LFTAALESHATGQTVNVIGG